MTRNQSIDSTPLSTRRQGCRVAGVPASLPTPARCPDGYAMDARAGNNSRAVSGRHVDAGGGQAGGEDTARGHEPPLMYKTMAITYQKRHGGAARVLSR